jgi:hypothetical protein
MARILVAFESKYGSTKQYAEWIAQKTGGEAVRASDVKPESLAEFGAVAFGGYLHAGRIRGAEFVSRNWGALQGKKVVVFSVSGTPPDDPALLKVFENAYPAEMRAKIKYFPLRGRAGKLDALDRVLMLFPKAKAYLQYLRTGDKGALQAYERMLDFDFVSEESVEPVVRELAAEK